MIPHQLPRTQHQRCFLISKRRLRFRNKKTTVHTTLHQTKALRPIPHNHPLTRNRRHQQQPHQSQDRRQQPYYLLRYIRRTPRRAAGAHGDATARAQTTRWRNDCWRNCNRTRRHKAKMRQPPQQLGTRIHPDGLPRNEGHSQPRGRLSRLDNPHRQHASDRDHPQVDRLETKIDHHALVLCGKHALNLVDRPTGST